MPGHPCCVICADAAVALARLTGWTRKIPSFMIFNQCVIYRQALVAKEMSAEFA